MYYIRTKKNKYDIDVIIDVTSDSTFKSHTSLEWKDADIASPGPIVGHYWHGGKSIGLDSADYSEIQTIINSVEEPIKVERDKEPTSVARPDASVVVPEDFQGSHSGSEFAKKLDKQKQFDAANNAGKSVASERSPHYVDEPHLTVPNETNYTRLCNQLENAKVMNVGLSTTTNYTVTPASDTISFTTVTFNPSLTFADKDAEGNNIGITTVNVPPQDDKGSGDISDWITYWSELEVEIQADVDKMKSDLGL